MTALVILTATLPGAVGNTLAVSTTSSSVSLDSGTLLGGVDYPLYAPPTLDSGVENFTVAGDQWPPDKTNALSAIGDVTASEWGWFYCQLDGTLTWRNRSFLFEAPATASAMTTAGGEATLNGVMDIAQIYNDVLVSSSPRSTLSSGAIASTSNPILVPGQSGVERWNGTVVLPGGGSTTVTLPFQDQTTKKSMGGKSIITPLAPTTDWTANNKSDGTGDDYTGSSVITFSLVRNSSSVEISIKNTALGPMYITKLQVRGTGYVAYDSQNYEQVDAASQAAYGRRTLSVSLPMPTAAQFPSSLSTYLLSRYKDALYRVGTLVFQHIYTVGGVSLLSLRLGDIIQVTDAQTGISNALYLITGINHSFAPSGGISNGQFSFSVMKLDDTTYWILGDPVYGVLGTTSRPGI